ncbi:hypothetical protein FRC12_007096 [Ceratobasidium sp. 428]|nr:hypothetical protein FRC12_007096 [Ceratobasidium sp. 428]
MARSPSLSLPSDSSSASRRPDKGAHASEQDGYGKDILIFCDGTADKLAQQASAPKSTRSSVRIGDRPRTCFYVPGIGAGPAKNPMNILARVFGTTIGKSVHTHRSRALVFTVVSWPAPVNSIVTAYLYISNNYKPGDHI